MAWTPQEVLTVIVALSSSLFALGAMIAAFVATSQTKKYLERPRIAVHGVGWVSYLGGPGYLLKIVNIGQDEAYDLWITARMPGSRRRLHIGHKESLSIHAPWELETSLVNGDTSEGHWLIDPPNFRGKPPRFGKWVWTITIQSSFDPNKKEKVVHKHRVTPAQFEAGVYTSVG